MITFSQYFRLLLLAVALTACAVGPRHSDGKSLPSQQDSSSFSQLGKSDLDRMADVEMRANTKSLELLMTKLYKRNPRELRKSTSGTAEKMSEWVFYGNNNWKFKALNNAQGTEAIKMTFDPGYRGDRVLALIVGLQTMLIKAHSGKTDFYLTDTIDPQSIYNVARNIEIVVWKLSNLLDAEGQPFLLTNELNDNEKNLSYEREFGKIIGRLDLYAVTISEKSQRLISRVVQNLATALFLPF